MGHYKRKVYVHNKIQVFQCNIDSTFAMCIMNDRYYSKDGSTEIGEYYLSLKERMEKRLSCLRESE